MEIGINLFIDMAHRLHNYKGKCARIHGHTYKIKVIVEGNKRQRSGMVLDFKKLKEIVKDNIAELLDHKLVLYKKDELVKYAISNKVECLLNSICVVPFNPTAENLAEFIFKRLNKALRKFNIKVSCIIIYEGRDSYAIKRGL